MKRSSWARENARRTRGLVAATVVGWALIAAPSLVSVTLDSHPGSPEAAAGLMLGLLVPAAVVGLPVSLIFCFLLGDPAWALAERSGVKGKRGAAKVGGLLGIVLYVLWAMVGAIAGTGSSPQDAGLVWHPPIAPVAVYAFAYAVAAGTTGGLAAWFAAGGRSIAAPENET